MTVIRHDFGKTKRMAVRRFRQLLSLDIEHEANIRTNPVPYLERASERIYQLEKALFDAVDAARAPLRGVPRMIEIDERQYLGFMKCRDIIEQTLAACQSADHKWEPEDDV